MNQTFLPVCKEDMEERGWEQLDFLFISGDAYVDHPSFAPAVICRVLEAAGYKVAILPQPDWNSPQSFQRMGKPRLGVLVCGGNLDSMLCHYTAARKPRKEDKYSPGKEMGKRPDHATLVYAKAAKKLWPDLPVIIGGIEASLRRFAHYDYWEDKLLPSILTESGADLLVLRVRGAGEGEEARLLHRRLEHLGLRDGVHVDILRLRLDLSQDFLLDGPPHGLAVDGCVHCDLC